MRKVRISRRRVVALGLVTFFGTLGVLAAVSAISHTSLSPKGCSSAMIAVNAVRRDDQAMSAPPYEIPSREPIDFGHVAGVASSSSTDGKVRTSLQAWLAAQLALTRSVESRDADQVALATARFTDADDALFKACRWRLVDKAPQQ